MKSFACGAVIPGCDAHFVEPTEHDIIAKVKGHARDDHSVVHLDEQTLIAVRANIQTTAA